MRFRTQCLVLLSGVLAWATAAPADGGRQLVDQKCSGCHATGPDGVSTNPDAPTCRCPAGIILEGPASGASQYAAVQTHTGGN